MPDYSIDLIKERFRNFDKVGLVQAPTPFRKLERFSRQLGGPEIYIKRDDLTGLAFGGNKSRKLEYIIRDAIDRGADDLVTWGGSQSNWCLQTAAAARMFGLNPVLLLFTPHSSPGEIDGNHLLDFILGADIKLSRIRGGKVIQMADIEEILSEVVAEIRDRGRKPYIAPIGGSLVGGDMQLPLGAIAYCEVFVELWEQAKGCGFEPDYLVMASGSGSTQAGLTVGAKALGGKTGILGISVSEPEDLYRKDVWNICCDTVDSLMLDLDLTPDDVLLNDEYVAGGYGVVDRDVAEAVQLMAVNEGIFLDPVYTGKALVGLIDLVKKGYFPKKSRLVFHHTGGLPAIFPNRNTLLKYLSG